MAKPKLTYKVQRGDDYIRIADKLYGDKRYHTALKRQNPKIKKPRPGTVINLLDDDPKEMWKKRERGRRRKANFMRKDWENAKQRDGIDPDFQAGLTNLVEATAQSMGLDANVMLDELGLGEGKPPSTEESSTGWTQSRTEKGNLRSPRISPGRKSQSQTGDGSPPTKETTSTTPTMTDRQKKQLKKELSEMGLDEKVVMEELGFGQGAASQKAIGTAGKGLSSDLRSGQYMNDLKGIATLGETFGAGQAKLKPAERSTTGPTLSDELEKTLNDIARDMGMDVDLMIGELGLVKRDDDELQDHLEMLGIPPEIYDKTSGVGKALIESDYIKLNMGIFPEKRGMYIPAGHFLDHSGFAEGYSEWEQGDYYFVPKNKEYERPNAAQYMVPWKITENDNMMKSPHYNLCGQLAVIAAMGLDLAEGLNLFAEIDIDSGDRELYGLSRGPKKGVDILNNGRVGTTYLTLINFINHATNGEYTGMAHSSNNNQKEFGSVDYLQESIKNGNKIIALVNINKSNEGGLNAKDDTNDPTAHWIEVQDVITTKDGETLVRVYNPYMNREEIYDEKTFMDAWEKTGDTKEKNNSNRHLIIEISETGE